MRWLRRQWALVEVTRIRPYLPTAISVDIRNGERVVSKHWTLFGARQAQQDAEDSQGAHDAAERARCGGYLRHETSFYVQPI